jgi:hypothetical protein
MTESYGKIGSQFGTPTTAAEFKLGECNVGSDGTEWVYVQASGAVSQYDAVAIDEDFQARALTKALADAGHTIGVAQAAFTDDQYGWVALKGTNISVNVLSSCASDSQLYTTGTSGKLDDASTNQTAIDGIVITTAASGATQAEECIISAGLFGAQR